MSFQPNTCLSFSLSYPKQLHDLILTGEQKKEMAGEKRDKEILDFLQALRYLVVTLGFRALCVTFGSVGGGCSVQCLSVQTAVTSQPHIPRVACLCHWLKQICTWFPNISTCVNLYITTLSDTLIIMHPTSWLSRFIS